MATSEEDRITLQAISIPPEFAERMRQRRPGYDQIYNLIQDYEAIPPDELIQMSETEVAKRFVRPMFQALGWSIIWDEPASHPFHLILDYQELRVPAEIRKFDDPLSSYTDKRRGSWEILTNFEKVLIWDVTDIDRPAVLLQTGPRSYIVDGDDRHDLLVARIFYEKLVQPISKEPQQTQEPIPELISRLSNQEGRVPQAAGEALGKLDAPQAIPALLALLGDADAAVRKAAAEALGEQGASQANPDLLALLQDQDAAVRQAAAKALGDLGAREAIPALINLLQDTDGAVRQTIATVLGRLEAREAFSALTELLQDRDEGVRQTATDSLRMIGVTIPPLSRSMTASYQAEGVISASQSTSERHEIAIRALADKPSDVDLLGFTDYAEALADFIKEPRTEKPLTIGIDAAWGMGKTTLMKMLQQRLAGAGRATWGRQSFPTVWFNAWKYDEEESLWAALVLEILGQIRQQLTGWQRIWLSLQLNWKRFDWGLLWQKILKYLIVYIFLVGILGTLTFGIASLWLGATWQESWQKVWQYIQLVGGLGFLAAIYAAGKQVFDSLTNPFELKLEQYIRQPNYAERIGFLAQFEADFKRVIEVVTEKGKWPLIVFIDDLDRCAPPKPVEIIEAINLLLDSQHCVFVLGMDAQTVAGSIEAKYKDLLEKLVENDALGSLTLGQRFLEKIIQINFRIPKVNLTLIASFVEANLASQAKETAPPPIPIKVTEAENLIKAEQRIGTESVDQAAQVVQATRPDLSPDVIAAAKEEVRAKSFDDSEEVKQAIREAVPYLSFNPRKIKRFINLLRLQALIANRRGLLDQQVIRLDLLGTWLLLATLWPDAVEAIATDPIFVDRLGEAYTTQEKLQEHRSKASEATKEEIKTEEVVFINEQIKTLEGSLNNYLADPLIKRLISTPDFIELLMGIDTSKPEVFSQYLHLAQIGVDSSAKQQPTQSDVK